MNLLSCKTTEIRIPPAIRAQAGSTSFAPHAYHCSEWVSGGDMAVVTIRKLPDATHRALKVRAARNGRSTEAEIRAILNDAVIEPGQVRLGTLLREIGRDVGGVDLDITRDSTPYEPVDLT